MGKKYIFQHSGFTKSNIDERWEGGWLLEIEKNNQRHKELIKVVNDENKRTD